MGKPNGCGPWWLPDNFKGDYFKDACDIHDKDYEDGIDREKSDKRFYFLMLERIKQEKDWKVRYARKAQARFFYYVVRVFGWTSHKKGINS